ncbi:MAG: hypothetical protein ABIR46_00915 [Candidatus Saccharimonadales bacterium]
MPTPELYIWHERKSLYTISRFYFARELSDTLFRSQIHPAISRLPELNHGGSVRGYPNNVSVQWGHHEVIPLGNIPHGSLQLKVERTTEVVLNHAFGWRASLLQCVAGAEHATEIAQKLNVEHDLNLNWSKGQFEL